MNAHSLTNLAPLAIIAFFVLANLWKRFTNLTTRGEAAAAAQTPSPAPRVTGPAGAVPKPPAAVRPPRPVPRPAALLPAAAAAAFPGLDLSLPGADVAAVFTVRRRRPIGPGGIIGSRGWGAGAIVALEVLGPPVSIRSGATLGAPHAL